MAHHQVLAVTIGAAGTAGARRAGLALMGGEVADAGGGILAVLLAAAGDAGAVDAPGRGGELLASIASTVLASASESCRHTEPRSSVPAGHPGSLQAARERKQMVR
jgi:hypothetical protein